MVKTIQECNSGDIKVTIEGDVNKIDCGGSVEVHGNSGSIDCGGSCEVSGGCQRRYRRRWFCNLW